MQQVLPKKRFKPAYERLWSKITPEKVNEDIAQGYRVKKLKISEDGELMVKYRGYQDYLEDTINREMLEFMHDIIDSTIDTPPMENDEDKKRREDFNDKAFYFITILEQRLDLA